MVLNKGGIQKKGRIIVLKSDIFFPSWNFSLYWLTLYFTLFLVGSIIKAVMSRTEGRNTWDCHIIITINYGIESLSSVWQRGMNNEFSSLSLTWNIIFFLSQRDKNFAFLWNSVSLDNTIYSRKLKHIPFLLVDYFLIYVIQFDNLICI